MLFINYKKKFYKYSKIFISYINNFSYISLRIKMLSELKSNIL